MSSKTEELVESLANTIIRLATLELHYKFLIENNPSLNLPSPEQNTQINRRAIEDAKLVLPKGMIISFDPEPDEQ